MKNKQRVKSNTNVIYYADLEYIKKHSIEAFQEALRLKYKRDF